ncbi:DNA polymerase III subunit delta [Candidatus Electronema sp. JC]|uniref:DNA polymerase III subunit delta n=1 Tax=Candidatus Electronema sp. JC TaxID=3401570 RepID=UPI003B42F32A
MPVYDRSKLNDLLREISGGAPCPALLLFGERSLCQQAAEQVCTALCTKGGTVHAIDGDSEDHGSTLAKLRSFSLLGGRQVFRVNGSRIFHSKNVAEAIWKKAVKAWEEGSPDKAAKQLRAMLAATGLDSADDPGSLSEEQWKKCFGFAKPAGNLSWTGTLLDQMEAVKSGLSAGDAGELLLAALESGLPKNNTLLLLAEELDKRKKLYKSFSAKFAVLDLSVDTGSSSQAKKEQEAVLREQIGKTLQEFGKTLDKGVIEQLLERVGFHPAAAVMETEKLILSVGDAPRITLDDLNRMVGRTREEAVFELTEAVGNKNLEKALFIAGRLQENGIHGLAVLATLRNYVRSLLLFRSLLEQEQYRWRPGIAANVFQEQCLPLLKANPRWQSELSGHPYALYMKFKTAAGFPLPLLRHWMQLLLAADRRLKGSPVAADTVVQHLLLAMSIRT